MAIRPDYTIGTLTLSSGSENFTTSGSSLQTAAVQAGDEIITPSGDVLIIATITGQNSGTLFLPCPATAAGAGLALRIRFQPDGSRYQGAVRDLVERIANGILENIAAIPVQDGKTLVGNAAGQYEPRDYIADTNGSLGKLAALALEARQILQTDATGALIQVPLVANRLIVTNANGDIAGRSIVGTVSQSSGVPTGSIIETGSNANGTYTKYADGTMICRHFLSGQTSTANGSLFIGDGLTFTFPAAFSGVPSIAFGTERTAGSGVVMATASSADMTATGVSVRPTSTMTGAWCRVYYIAFGRWF